MNTNPPDSPFSIITARGNVYVPVEVYDCYFKGMESVALLPHPEGVLLLPLIQQAAGGLLFKIRNLRGDRIIHAQEFLRTYGYAESESEKLHSVRWLSDRAALLICGIFPSEVNLLST